MTTKEFDKIGNRVIIIYSTTAFILLVVAFATYSQIPFWIFVFITFAVMTYLMKKVLKIED